jgi:hypothetical protein
MVENDMIGSGKNLWMSKVASTTNNQEKRRTLTILAPRTHFEASKKLAAVSKQKNSKMLVSYERVLREPSRKLFVPSGFDRHAIAAWQKRTYNIWQQPPRSISFEL